jgi:unsaturated rhamnogalacturonyl hydrolase
MKNATLAALDLGRAFARTVAARNAPGTYSWHYETGLILQAIWKLSEKIGDAELRAYVKACADALVSPDGTISGYKTDEFNLDQINAGKILLVLAAEYGDPRYAAAAKTLRAQLSGQPRTAAGGFWHKKIYPYQMWLDGLYMQAPFSIRWGLEKGDAELVDDVCDQLLLVEKKTRDDSAGLLYHAWDESRKQLWADPENGRSPHAWGRAMGWYSMALVDCLELLPPTHPKRATVVAVLERTAATIASSRDRLSGIWLQVLDQPSRPGNYPEASASSMFCYALAKGVALGLLPQEKYAGTAREAFAALTDRYVTVDDSGNASLAGICKVAGLGGEPYRDGSFSYYIGEPVVADDFKGVGPYILAATELG